jgi:hypothetical protein
MRPAGISIEMHFVKPRSESRGKTHLHLCDIKELEDLVAGRGSRIQMRYGLRHSAKSGERSQKPGLKLDDDAAQLFLVDNDRDLDMLDTRTPTSMR